MAPRDTVLHVFYATRAYTPAWAVNGVPTALADSALIILTGAPEHGLDADAFGYAVAAEARDRMRTLPASPAAAARFDVSLTQALLRYGDALRRGQVDPRRLHPGWNAPARSRDVAGELSAAHASGSMRAFVRRIAPRSPAYLRLQEALADLRRISGPWPALPAVSSLEWGATGPAVAALHDRLAALGDLRERPAAGGVFDSTLLAAVVHFQRRHGLPADGVVGPATRTALDVPVEARIRQVALNLERLRWMPPMRSGRFVVVNMAGCRLVVVEDGQVVMEMSAIVGATDTKTPVFDAAITGVILAPAWYAPESIAEAEILPKVELDSSYLVRHGMKILPSGVIRQEPGPANPLGRVKFVVSNPYDIGLHDTPEQRLFSAPHCTFSHGCVRLGRPIDLAAYVLRDRPDWPLARIEAHVDTWVETTIAVAPPIPVYVVYHTAWVDEEGTLQFRLDRYGHDTDLDRAMGRP
jgi:murein L,D-transpeptidase YcbB/YkuD